MICGYRGPFVEFGEHRVGSVELVAGGGEVLADRAELSAAVVAVFQEPGGRHGHAFPEQAWPETDGPG